MILDDVNSVKELAEKLSKCPVVSRYDSPGEPEGWRIAYALSDIESSCRKIFNILLPELLKAETDEKIEESLHEIREELRHVHYHIKDPRYFSYML